MPETLRIAVHVKPGPDALVATWLAERFMCATELSEVVFLPKGHILTRKDGPAWYVEPGRILELIGPNWGCKRQKFAERYATSATGHIWTHLLSEGKPVAHLVDLVDAVHDGALTAGTTPVNDQAGLWTKVNLAWKKATARAAGDLATHQAMRAWLDQYEASLGAGLAVPVDWEQVAGRFPHGLATYALVMQTATKGGVLIGQTGRLGRMEVVPGYYVYGGSAGMPPDGLHYRLRWHLTLARDLKLQKQVDFLRLRCSVVEVWFTVDPFTTSPLERECVLNMCVLAMPGATVPMPRFGSTDCRTCPAHLAHFEDRPSFRSFQAMVKRSAMPCRVQRVVLG